MTDFTPCQRTVELCAEVADHAGKTPWDDLVGRVRKNTAGGIAQAIRALIKETSND